MQETFKKLYAVTGDAKLEVGNTRMGQGVTTQCDTQTHTVACGFLGVS